MVTFHEASGVIKSRHLGRIASYFYLSHGTIDNFGKLLDPQFTEEQIFELLCHSTEFETLKVRDEELTELMGLKDSLSLRIRGDETSIQAKINILIQCYISRYQPQEFSLVSDMNYIDQNVGRILRALFEIVFGLNWGQLSRRILDLCKAFERRQWMFLPKMSQFALKSDEQIPWEKISDDMSLKDIESIVRNKSTSFEIHRALNEFPSIDFTASVEPISANVIQISHRYFPKFNWNKRIHGARQIFWLMLEDLDSLVLYHKEQVIIAPESVFVENSSNFYIPIPENCQRLILRLISDSWLHCESCVDLKLSGLSYPKDGRVFTDLLPLPLLPIEEAFEKNSETCSYFSKKFTHFNPVQTQVFHTLYHLSNESTLVGAPTGSGKTVLAELALFASLRDYSDCLVVYIAPLKALVHERILDWKSNLPSRINVAELSGDVDSDYRELSRANLIVTTPEKWDLVTRNWRKATFIQRTRCIIIDEIHLIGSERGHVLEAIVPRFVHTTKTRFIGLSTALANALDLAQWLGIKREFVFGFKSTVRPIPVTVRLEGFPGRHYCPRMASMNKPIYQAIKMEVEDHPVLVFVSSRRQTRLTAQALISLCSLNNSPFKSELSEDELVLVEDDVMRFCLSFGITLHHAGLSDSDRKLSEKYFVNRRVQIMIATSTVAWGVNFPARLVIIKGCEYYCAKKNGYVPYPITDVMQMVGRAGRPQFDDKAIAVILVEEERKTFYKRFLYDPFPAESSLIDGLSDHLNAEVASTQRIKSFDDSKKWFRKTFLAIRLETNPCYYHNKSPEEILTKGFNDLEKSGCVEFRSGEYKPTEFGRIAANFYLRHQTIRYWIEFSGPDDKIEYIVRMLSQSPEFSEFSFRHNEDIESKDLLRLLVSSEKNKHYKSFVESATGTVYDKVFALILAWISDIDVGMTDWRIDQSTLVEQYLGRVLSALIYFYSMSKFFKSVVNSLSLFQLISKKPAIASLTLTRRENKLQIKCKLNEDAVESDGFYVWIVYSNENEELVELKRKKISLEKVFTDELPPLPVQVHVFPEFTGNYRAFFK